MCSVSCQRLHLPFDFQHVTPPFESNSVGQGGIDDAVQKMLAKLLTRNREVRVIFFFHANHFYGLESLPEFCR